MGGQDGDPWLLQVTVDSKQLCPGKPLMAELKLAQGVAQRPLPSFWVPSSPALRSPWLQRGPLAGTCHGDVLTEPSTWEPGKETPGIQSWSRHPQGPHGVPEALLSFVLDVMASETVLWDRYLSGACDLYLLLSFHPD